MYEILLARIQAEYDAEARKLAKVFHQEMQQFHEAFKEEIMKAYAAAIDDSRPLHYVSPTLHDALARLERSQERRSRDLFLKYQAEALLLAQRARKEAGVTIELN